MVVNDQEQIAPDTEWQLAVDVFVSLCSIASGLTQLIACLVTIMGNKFQGCDDSKRYRTREKLRQSKIDAQRRMNEYEDRLAQKAAFTEYDLRKLKTLRREFTVAFEAWVRCGSKAANKMAVEIAVDFLRWDARKFLTVPPRSRMRPKLFLVKR